MTSIIGLVILATLLLGLAVAGPLGASQVLPSPLVQGSETATFSHSWSGGGRMGFVYRTSNLSLRRVEGSSGSTPITVTVTDILGQPEGTVYSQSFAANVTDEMNLVPFGLFMQVDPFDSELYAPFVIQVSVQ